MKSMTFALRAAALSFVVWGCGTLVDMSGGSADGVERRVYVNDAAPNESLPSVIINDGVYFVMQPGKQYQVRVRTGGVSEQLQVLRARDGFYYGWKTLTPTAAPGVDSTQLFTLQPETGDSARYYLAFLQSATGGKAERPRKVSFIASPAPATTLKVKVVLLRQLTGLPEGNARNAFGQALVDSLISVYSDYNVSVTGSYEVLQPSGARFVADFGAANDFPGTREPGTAYLYVVDNIRYQGAENAGVLGFAPREGFSLSGDAVVLNVRGMSNDADPAARAKPLAVTAAHELGHLFGLRHTTSSEADRNADFDKSNTFDGFPETPRACAGSLPKRGVAGGGFTDIRVPGGRHYCLRVAANECACPDAGNLMFAYQCGENQNALSTSQIGFLRANIALFQ